jgi:hypothetical protein
VPGLDCGAQRGVQRDRLIERVAAANRRTIVVLETAGPVLTPWRDRVGAIVEAWYPGSAAGEAIARVLFGDVDPGGRCRPRSRAASATCRRPATGAATPARRTSCATPRASSWAIAGTTSAGSVPAYPFGHGLSYTSFALRNLSVRRSRSGVGATVSVTVVNRGSREGTAVPQVYVGLPGARGRVQPPRQLKGYQSIDLRRGAAKRLTFRLDRRAFSYWDTRRHRWEVARGCYQIQVGQSSRDIDARAALPLRGARLRLSIRCRAFWLAVVALALPAPAAAAPAPVGDLAAHPGSLQRVPDRFRPLFRWWWPGDTVDPAELRAELRGVKAAGFAGVEQILLANTKQWGTPAFRERTRVALREAQRLGLRLDITLGPGWPVSSPSVEDLTGRRRCRTSTTARSICRVGRRTAGSCRTARHPARTAGG